jgi:hypothetical protein
MQPANLGRKQTMLSLVWKKPNGGFLKWGYPKMDGLNGKIVLKWMTWGYPHFRKSPNVIQIQF